jgi:hypothetical protein
MAPPTVKTTPVDEERRRYNEHMARVRGLAPKTRDMALARLEAPDTKIRRYKAPDSLMRFLQAL